MTWDDEDGVFDPRGDSVAGRRARCPRCRRRVVEWELVEAIGLCERCADREPAPPPRSLGRPRRRTPAVVSGWAPGSDLRIAFVPETERE